MSEHRLVRIPCVGLLVVFPTMLLPVPPIIASDCLGISRLTLAEDIPRFVKALVAPTACHHEICAADLNGDGNVDGRDVAAYVDCVLFDTCLFDSVIRINEVLPFDWAAAPKDFGFFTSLNTNHGLISDQSCPATSTIEDGLLCIQTDSGPSCPASFEGRFISLRGDSSETFLTLDLADPMPDPILPQHRISVPQIRVRVQGLGQYRVEIKDGSQTVIYNVLHSVNSPDFVEAFFDLPPTLPDAKFLNLVVESQPLDSDLCFDRIDLVVGVPQPLIDDPLLYGALTSYCQVLRGLETNGFTKDRNTARTGVFLSIPATGLQILAAALATDLGLISLSDAQAIAEDSVAALLSSPTELNTGLLPHFVEITPGGVAKIADSEWSSVDTAIACVAAVEGLQILGMTNRINDVQTQIIDQICWPALTNAEGEISHGVAHTGDVLTATWDTWGGELTIVEILRAMTDPMLPPAIADRTVEHFQGTGFIIELAALFIPNFGAAGFGPDQYGADWHNRRAQHLADQMVFTSSELFGLSAVEIINPENACTEFLAAGIGTCNPPALPIITVKGFGFGPWIAPHYMSMVAGLDVEGATDRIRILRDLRNQWPALNGPPESIELGMDGCGDVSHRLQVTLNAAFNFIGLYHAILVQNGGLDQAYGAASAYSILDEAVAIIFNGKP